MIHSWGTGNDKKYVDLSRIAYIGSYQTDANYCWISFGGKAEPIGITRREHAGVIEAWLAYKEQQMRSVDILGL